jgi:hypothetical protein
LIGFDRRPASSVDRIVDSIINLILASRSPCQTIVAHSCHDRIPRIDLGAIKTDLEFLIDRVTRFRKEQALKPLYTMVGSAWRTWLVLPTWWCGAG